MQVNVFNYVLYDLFILFNHTNLIFRFKETLSIYIYSVTF